MNKIPTLVRALPLSAICAACVHSQHTQQPSTTADKWEAAIRTFEEADQHNPPSKGAVLFIGSSSIGLWTTLADDFPSTEVINRGFGGSEIADSTYYVDRIVAPYQPKVIVLYAGDNDLVNGKTPQQVFEDYQAFVSRVRRKLPRARVAFISIKPSPARWHVVRSVRAANEMIRSYASRGKGLIYIDVFTPMIGADGNPRPELFSEDNLHLNREGYRLWKSIVAPHIH